MGAVFVMILLRRVIAHCSNWVVVNCGENQGDATMRKQTWGGGINVNRTKEHWGFTVSFGWKKRWAFYQHYSRIPADFPLFLPKAWQLLYLKRRHSGTRRCTIPFEFNFGCLWIIGLLFPVRARADDKIAWEGKKANWFIRINTIIKAYKWMAISQIHILDLSGSLEGF